MESQVDSFSIRKLNSFNMVKLRPAIIDMQCSVFIHWLQTCIGHMELNMKVPTLFMYFLTVSLNRFLNWSNLSLQSFCTSVHQCAFLENLQAENVHSTVDCIFIMVTIWCTFSGHIFNSLFTVDVKIKQLASGFMPQHSRVYVQSRCIGSNHSQVDVLQRSMCVAFGSTTSMTGCKNLQYKKHV